MIKIKCVAMVLTMLLIASGLIFEVTGRTQYFAQIFVSMSVGLLLGLGFYWYSLYYGNKIMVWVISRSQTKQSRAYLKIK